MSGVREKGWKDFVRCWVAGYLQEMNEVNGVHLGGGENIGGGGECYEVCWSTFSFPYY